MSPDDRAGAQVLDVAHRQPERIVGLRGHPIGPAQDVEVVDEGRAHIGRQRVEEARDRHAQHLGLGAVDVGVDLRRRGVEQREDLNEAGRLVGRTDDAADRLLERARAAAGAVLDIQLEAAAGADAGHRGRRNHQHEGFAQRLHLAAQIVQDGRRSSSPAFTRSSNGFRVTKTTPELGALVKVAPSKPANATACATPGRDSRISDALRTTRSVRSRLEPGGKRDRGDEIGAVERRDEARRRAGELEIGQPDQPAIDRPA